MEQPTPKPARPHIKRCPACRLVKRSSQYRVVADTHDRRAAHCYDCEAAPPRP